MSGQLTTTQTFGQLVGDIVDNLALTQTGRRVIGNLHPHITVEEIHSDELTVTQHPVETGTPITDHSYFMPCTVEIHCGWSDSTAATVGFVQAVYKRLLALQAMRQPFTIRTGKRTYSSMLLRSVGVKTDPESEYALEVSVLAQQIVITSTQVGVSSSDGQLSDNSSAVANTSNPPVSTGKPGELGTPVSGGADPAPVSEVSPDETGAVTWANGPIGTGTLTLNTVPTGPQLDNLMSQFAQ